jgi:hypothetical protein
MFIGLMGATVDVLAFLILPTSLNVIVGFRLSARAGHCGR